METINSPAAEWNEELRAHYLHGNLILWGSGERTTRRREKLSLGLALWTEEVQDELSIKDLQLTGEGNKPPSTTGSQPIIGADSITPVMTTLIMNSPVRGLPLLCNRGPPESSAGGKWKLPSEVRVQPPPTLVRLS